MQIDLCFVFYIFFKDYFQESEKNKKIPKKISQLFIKKYIKYINKYKFINNYLFILKREHGPCKI